MGGQLLSSLSGENIGFYNYDIKLDFRRNFDREIRREGDVLFCPKMFDVDGVPSIPMPDTTDPITLIVMARHPNGKTMVIVGTATTLWRYYGMENPLYFESDYFEAGYYDETLVAWDEIGSGFSANGRRWECETNNGYLILNNAVDLPVTYRITDDSVTPIYELRELAVASVGTILVQNSCLLCMDIKQIKEDKFLEIMTPISSAVDASASGAKTSGAYTATVNDGTTGVAGNTITASGYGTGDFTGFTGMIGQEILLANGVKRTILSAASDTEATLDGDPVLVEPAVKFTWVFILIPIGIVSPQFQDIFPTVTPDINLLKGMRMFWDSGEIATITSIYAYAIVDNYLPIPSGPLKLENPLAYRTFTDEAYIDRIQNRVIHSLPDQPRRFGATYPGSISPQSDVMDFDYPVKSIGLNAGQLTMTGMKSGNLTVDGVYYDGLQFLVGGGAIRKFYADVLTALEAAQLAEANAITAVNSIASTLITAEDALAKANEAAAADPDDADLAAAATTASVAVDAIRDLKVKAEAAVVAATTAREEAETKSLESEEIEAQLTDSLTSLEDGRLGDLQNDGAAILKAVSLKTVAVIFTETAIFIARYVPSIESFTYELIEIPPDRALFYRNTPVVVTIENSTFIAYAAETQFCRFDMTTQMPVDLPVLQGLQDLFFNEADPEDMERIFAVDNPVTSEVLFVFPSSSANKAICFDYAYNTASTTSAEYTAGANVTLPGTRKSAFLLGTSDGKVLRYGLLAGGVKPGGTASKTGNIVEATSAAFNETHIGQTIRFGSATGGSRFGVVKLISATQVEVVGSGDVEAQSFYIEPACWHRRGASYASILQAGADAFKNEGAEKKMSRYWLMLSSFSPNNPISVFIRSGRNVNEVADKITTSVIPPQTLVAPIISDYFLSDRLEISGINNPLELTGRAAHITGVDAAGFGRRKT